MAKEEIKKRTLGIYTTFKYYSLVLSLCVFSFAPFCFFFFFFFCFVSTLKCLSCKTPRKHVKHAKYVYDLQIMPMRHTHPDRQTQREREREREGERVGKRERVGSALMQTRFWYKTSENQRITGGKTRTVLLSENNKSMGQVKGSIVEVLDF